jgi:hypothetical protein
MHPLVSALAAATARMGLSGAVAAASPAGRDVTLPAFPPRSRLIRQAHELSSACPQVAPTPFRRSRRPGARPAGARARPGQRPAAPRLPVHRHARRGQDDHRAHPRQGAELRGGRVLDTLRRVRLVSRHRRRALRGPDRGRCGLAHEDRGYPRPARQRAVLAGARPLQGVPHRRGPHALAAFLQCAVEDARGTAAACEVPARDHRSAEPARDGAVPLPAVQPEAPAGLHDPRAPAPGGRE